MIKDIENEINAIINSKIDNNSDLKNVLNLSNEQENIIETIKNLKIDYKYSDLELEDIKKVLSKDIVYTLSSLSTWHNNKKYNIIKKIELINEDNVVNLVGEMPFRTGMTKVLTFPILEKLMHEIKNYKKSDLFLKKLCISFNYIEQFINTNANTDNFVNHLHNIKILNSFYFVKDKNYLEFKNMLEVYEEYQKIKDEINQINKSYKRKL